LRTALDTNIPSALLSKEHVASAIIQQLDVARRAGTLHLSPPAYAELLAHPRATEALIHQFLQDTDIRVDFPLLQSVWTEAGRRYARYAARRRQSQGTFPKRLLADFLIGAHALLQADRLMTLDPSRYRTDFPELVLYPIQP
jgi:predicted nucleic acid-binding protein